jgi:hypothetical protein
VKHVRNGSLSETFTSQSKASSNKCMNRFRVKRFKVEIKRQFHYEALVSDAPAIICHAINIIISTHSSKSFPTPLSQDQKKRRHRTETPSMLSCRYINQPRISHLWPRDTLTSLPFISRWHLRSLEWELRTHLHLLNLRLQCTRYLRCSLPALNRLSTIRS